jgi:phosphoribosylanthranilate isomerase
MKIKVCGMNHPENIKQTGSLPVDYMGFIFYPPSPRFAGNGILNSTIMNDLSPRIKRVGVFVSEAIPVLLSTIKRYPLDVVQLHGAETPDYCRTVKENCPALKIIKAFNLSEAADFDAAKEYEAVCDFFLFDTKTAKHGGSGEKFDWKIIECYQGKTPFFLSGGISADDADAIKNIHHPRLYGIDLNSRFEIRPGIKDVNLLQTFIKNLKYEPD